MESQPDPPLRAPTEWWFVAILLGLFSLLMISHLGVLWVAVSKCEAYGDMRIAERVARSRLPSGTLQPEIEPFELCTRLQDSFNDVAQLYLATILALLSGAGYSVGKAYSTAKPKKDDPP